jgi:hypothetical protein
MYFVCNTHATTLGQCSFRRADTGSRHRGRGLYYVWLSIMARSHTFFDSPANELPCVRFVGLGEDPGVLAIRAPELFGVRP